jgi:hypothetical protein
MAAQLSAKPPPSSPLSTNSRILSEFAAHSSDVFGISKSVSPSSMSLRANTQ